MDTSGEPQPLEVWELRIDGRLDVYWSTWFDGLTLTHEVDGTTTLTGPVLDQTALHGLFSKLRDIGVTLISARAVAGPSSIRWRAIDA